MKRILLFAVYNFCQLSLAIGQGTCSDTLTSSLSVSTCSEDFFLYEPISTGHISADWYWSRVNVSGISQPAATGNGRIAETLSNTTSSPINVIYSFNINGCPNSNAQNVVVTVNPTARLTSSVASIFICSGSPFNYSPTTNISGATISWVRPTVSGILPLNSSGTGNISETLTSSRPATTRYFYTITLGNCSSGQWLNVTVNPIPRLASPLPSDPICNDKPVKFNPISTVNGTTFSWTRPFVSGILQSPSSGTGEISEVITNTTSVPVVVNYYYTLSANGCTKTDEIFWARVHPTPALTSPLTNSVCNGSRFEYSPTTSVFDNTLFSWSRTAVAGISQSASSGTSSISEFLSNTTTSPITVTYSYVILFGVIATNSGTSYACSTPSQNLTVTVNPIASISTSGATTFCTGGSVTLTSSAGSSYLWSTGATTQSITVNSSGSYTVRVTNANGCSATSAPTSVTVNTLPIATITASSGTTFCSGSSVTLTASTGSSYLWSTGATTQSITASTTGNYSVTVTTNGCSTTSSATSVTVNPRPVDGTISANTTSICLGQSVTISSSGGVGTPHYFASTNGGQVSWDVFSFQYIGQSSFSYTPTQVGTYHFAVRNQSACGFCWEGGGTCAPYSFVNVVVNPRPVDGTISASSTSICVGHSVTISSSGGTGAPYYWASSDGGASWNVFSAQYVGQASFSFTPTSAGTYRFHVRNQTACGFCWDSGNNGCPTYPYVDVVVNPRPVDGTISASSTSICLGQSVTISSSGGTGTSYYWASTNGGASWNVFAAQYVGQSSFSFVPTSLGTYRFHVRNQTACGFCWDSGNNGCPTYPYVDVVVNEVPSSSISGTTSFCSGSYTYLTAYPSGGYYYWSNGQSSQSINAYYGGYYGVTVYRNGCQSSSNIYVEEVNCEPDPGCVPPYCPCYDQNCPRIETPTAIEPTNEDVPNVNGLSVFPNPAATQFTVALPVLVKEDTRLVLMDVMGKQLISSTIPKGQWKVTIPLNGLVDGVYMVKINHKEYGEMKKVVVVH
jgi:hypothetical protein